MGIKIKNHKKINKKLIIPVVGAFALIGVSGLAANRSYAVETSDTTRVDVVIDPVLAIASPEAINVNLDMPTPDGKFVTGSGDISVATNNVAGYSVYIASNTDSTDLKHTNEGVISKVTTISNVETVAEGQKFSTNNTWGWSADGQTFKPVAQKDTEKSDNTLFKRTSSPATSGEDTALTIGVTGDVSLTSGTYSNTLLLTAITNSL